MLKYCHNFFSEDFKMNKIGITVIARLFGISPEAIRKYEKQGIILPQRDQDNNYRKFNFRDIAHLFRARQYTMCGFSLKEVTKMLSISNFDEAEALIKNKEDELALQILFIQRRLEILRQMKRNMEEMMKSSTELSYTFEQSPTVYFYDFIGSQALHEDKNKLQHISKWLEKLPFVFLGIRFDYEEKVDKEPRAVLSICVTKENREKYDLSDLPYTYCSKSKMCITTTFIDTYSKPLNKNDFQFMAYLLKSRNLRIAGEIWGEVKYSAKINDVYQFYHKLWVPVELM